MNKKTLAILVMMLILVALAGWFLSDDNDSVSDVTLEPSVTTVASTEILTDAPSITETPFPTAEPTIDYDY